MKVHLPIIPTSSARLLLLGAQGLLTNPSRTPTTAALQNIIEQLGFVQIDSINIVERAHHLTLASRLDGYRHDHFTQLLETERSLFEHWTHDASAIPTKWFPHWKPRFARGRERIRMSAWWRKLIGEEPDKVLDHVRERIISEGPLRSQDFEHERRGISSAWWGWKPQKAALEFLWQTGELMVARRVNFQKVYDLTERVLPEYHRKAQPTEDEHVEWACSTALERLGLATPKELADFWAAITPAQARAWSEEAAAKGRIAAVLVESLDGVKVRLAYAVIDWEQRLNKLPEPPEMMRLLCPFDPVLRDRARLHRLFGFNYRFEAFVPEPKRQYGYYVLPILEGERLVGRIDPRFHRARGVLEMRRVFWEPGVRVTRTRRKKLEVATERLARLIGAAGVESDFNELSYRVSK
ncbi:MAG: winged helix-turn-helix domain-containing protein [Pyrinomonadaceae bacterium]|nr:winged helix-turn-helix domain-containing protein [Pyrinomonadaceae bacterium]